MDKEIKLAIYITVGVFLGILAYKIVQGYYINYQIQKMTTEMTQSLERSSKQAQATLEASQKEQQRRSQERTVELARQKAIKEQTELEANLQCAASEDTGKCVCYDRRTKQPVKMSLEQCNAYVRR